MSDAYRIGKNPCPRCRENGQDREGDNFYWYGKEQGGFCFKCGYTELSEDEKEKRGIGIFEWTEEMEREVSTKEKLTKEEIEQIKGITGTRGNKVRGITDETYAQYYVRHSYNVETGEPSEQYYPVFENNELSAFKIRKLPKEFRSIGKLGNASDLFGAYRFRNSNSKKIVICAGEVDAMSAYQMLNKPDSEYDPIPCISAVVGETASYKQIKNHYEWLSRYSQIIICPDNDTAGQDALKKLVDVIPKGKMFVMSLPLKDANECLVQGKEKSFIDAFWKARPYTPDGILSSADLPSRMRQEAAIEKVPLPPFMHRLQKLMAGGIPLGRIVNLGSASGTGKSTIVDEMVYYWMFNSPHRIGIVSLESDAGQYGIKLLSRHVEQKIDLIETVEEKLDFMNSPFVLEKERELFFDEQGRPRFDLVDDRDGGVESLKQCVENLIVKCECKVIVLDPLQDILDGLSNEEQAVFLKWMKGMLKTYGVSFININHVRKSGGGQKANSAGADLHEEDFSGSSTIFKSGACNLIFTRDKEAEDETERNTTVMKMSKCRWTGHTSPFAGKYYYDNNSHKLYDYDDWMSHLDVNF